MVACVADVGLRPDIMLLTIILSGVLEFFSVVVWIIGYVIFVSKGGRVVDVKVGLLRRVGACMGISLGDNFLDLINSAS